MVTKNIKMKKYIVTFSAVFLLMFMGVIFGPIEMFFGNYKELELVFHEFAWHFILLGVGGAVVVSALIWLLPEKLHKLAVGVIWGISIAAYVQVMFANRGLEQLGATATGYETTVAEQWPNTILWMVIICAAIVIVLACKKHWKQIVSLSALYLIVIQLIGMVSLFVSADEMCYEIPAAEKGLDARKQYMVSANENIIFILLDNFSNEWLYEARLEDEHIIDCMKDFTYYNNADCNSYGTFPSLVHIITGNPIDISVKVNDYMEESWTNELTNQYFDLLKKNNYEFNLCVDEERLVLGSHPVDMLADKVSNITVGDEARTVDKTLMFEVMLKMSCYRYAPNVLKEFFTVQSNEYDNIVINVGEFAYYNPDFYQGLMEKGLSIGSEETNYFNFLYFNGMHEFINDSDCNWNGRVSRIECMRGVFKMVDEYFRQLKELGVYDNSTIIVLADHGSKFNGQPIFFIKEKNETHEEMLETSAPIDYDAIRPTIVQILGEDASEFGNTIYDYYDGQWRDRVFLERAYDPEYPIVKRYDGEADAPDNVWHRYTYCGDMWELIGIYQLERYETIPMVDSFY